jgi:hypothetical protein
MTCGARRSGPDRESSEEPGSRLAEADLLWLIDSTISHTSVTNRNDVDHPMTVIHMVDDPIVADTDTPEVLTAAEFSASRGTGFLGKGFDHGKYSAYQRWVKTF